VSERTSIAFSGSMKATPEMLAYTVKAVNRSMELGHFVNVGDNPNGVDLIVVKTMLEADYKQFAVWSVPGEKARVVVYLMEGKKPASASDVTDYMRRDQQLTFASHITFCVWNGVSRGTKTLYDFAAALGREAFLIDFSKPGTKGVAPLITKTPAIERAME
jgi:hypothetical protein